MKNIDQLVKKALENHEMPYENGAWEAMAKRLDAAPKSPFYKKWWVAASAGLILVSSATYFAFYTTETSKPVVIQANNLAKTSNENASVATNPSLEDSQASTTTKTTTNNVTVNSNSTELAEENNFTTYNSNLSNKTPKKPVLPKHIVINSNGSVDVKSDPVIVKDEHIVLQTPNYVCLKSDLVIHNPYATKNLFVVMPSNEEITIKPGQKYSIDCNDKGTIAIYADNKLEKSIEVVESKAAITIAVDPTLIYENGIPALRFTAPGLENKVTWDSGKVPSERENTDFIVHPYTTQDITVTATLTDENGCSVVESKSIHVEEKYNLMTMNTFSPNSNDPRNATFMPYALKERNTPFTLYVYDPKTGRVIFSTTDVENPWTGQDKTINEMVPQGSIWLWKVVLQHPNPGEPHEYKGTIRVL